MTNKEKYKLLCDTEGSRIPLYQQYWWMDTVCVGKKWDVLLVENEQGTIEGALPYLIGKKLGMRYILQPQLTQFSGPWYNETVVNLEFEHRVGGELAKQLKSLNTAFFLQRFSPNVTDWLPFYWQGYRQTTRYTYRLSLSSGLDALQSAASRSRLRNANDIQEAGYSVMRDFSPTDFARMHTDYWQKRSGSDLIGSDLIERLCTVATGRGQGLLWALADADSKPVGASFIVYDDQCAYALMSAYPNGAPRNAKSFVFWQMIEYLISKTRIFDFEGSMYQGIEHFYRSFGAMQTPIHEVSLCRNPLFNILLRLHH